MFVVRIDEPGHPDHGRYLWGKSYWQNGGVADLQTAYVWKRQGDATRRANAYPRDVHHCMKVTGPNCVVVPVTLIPGDPLKTKNTKSPEGVP